MVREMRLVVPVGRYCLRFLPQTSPVPVDKIRLLRKLCFGRDALFPNTEALQLTGRNLQNPVLRRMLEADEMGTWSMSPATLNFLEDEIHKQKPAVILELGSGLSTICLARYMYETHGPDGGTYICSLEQDADVIERTMKRLRALGLEKHVQIFHAPLSWQVIEGVRTSCYSLPQSFVDTIAALRPSFVVIDGPASETDRFGTLPLIRPYLDTNSQFYLDDALRDGELDVAKNWARLPYVQVNGIYLTEKGLLLGNLQSSAE
jgi:hypothetical protein